MRKLLFSVSIHDCRVDTFRSGGKGGQNQNKVESGVRVTHDPSGAVGEARDSRDQLRNKRSAFRRMCETNEFKSWHRAMTLRLLGVRPLEDVVEDMMQPRFLKIETWSGNGWKEE